MKVKPLMVFNVVLTICLVTALLFTSETLTGESKEYDPWHDTNDDGIIDMADISVLIDEFMTEGTPINKTALLLELLDRVEALENQTLPQGFISPPAYDSEWIPLEPAHSVTLHHDLNTTDIFVYMIGSVAEGISIHQSRYGCDWWNYPAGDEYRTGASWRQLNENTIDVYRAPEDASWNYVRLMIWVISEPT